jgi:hypothetical protein
MLCVALSAAPVRAPAADDVPRGETVTSRARPELDPLGMHMGSFFLYPALQVGGEKVDNIFADEQNPQADLISRLEPALTLQSDWNRHAVGGSISGVLARYRDNPSEDYDDGTAEAHGRLDVGHDSRVEAGGRFARLHEDRGSPDDVNGFEPTRYQASSVFASTSMGFGRWRMALDAATEWLFYENVPGTAGIINNKDRDRIEDEAGIELAYEFVPDRSVFARARANRRDYRAERDDFGLDRDSKGTEFVGGVRADFTGVAGGEIYAGRIAQDYEDPALPPLDATDFGATLTWNLTGLTTVGANLTRGAAETTFQGASSVRRTVANVGVDHELLRNLLLNVQAQRTDDVFDGIAREDAYDILTFGVRYLANRHLVGIVRFSEDRRDSNVAGEDYRRKRVLLALRGQF